MILPWVKWLLLLYRPSHSDVSVTQKLSFPNKNYTMELSKTKNPDFELYPTHHYTAHNCNAAWLGLKRRMVNFAIAFFVFKLPAISTKNKMSGHRYGHNGRCMLCAVLGGDRCMTLDIIEVLLWKKNPTTLLIKVVPTT